MTKELESGIMGSESSFHDSRLLIPGPWFFDLQLFAAEDDGRTEDPTGKKISKARDEGQVAKSVELVQVVNLFSSSLAVMVVFPRMVGYEMSHIRYFFENLSTLELSQQSLGILFMEGGLHILAITWPVMLVSIVASVGMNIAQVGWLFTFEPLKPKFNRIFPKPDKLIDRLVIGKTVIFNLFKSLVKLIGVSIIAWFVVTDELDVFSSLWKMQPFQAVETILEVAWQIMWKICLMLLILALADYAYQRNEWKDQLKMRKQEVKDEQKQAEGDPEVKRAQRKRMMEVARRRMMQEIPTADVVITNPTHFAVAIKYDQSVDDAPRVVAKGEGFMALKIRQIAEQHGIPLFEDKPLAQALFKGVEIGDRVPPQFFQAVARVLAHVYRAKKAAV